MGRLHVIQLLLVEAAVVGVLAVLAQDILVQVGVAALALVALAFALGRSQGRWWLERRVMAWNYRRRSRSGPATAAADSRLAGLRRLAPGLTVSDLPTPDGSQVGVARDDSGWYAAATVVASASMQDGPRPPAPLDVIVNALIEANQPGAVAQVVTHTVPAPVREDPANRSYQELLQRFGPTPAPVDRVTWVAVRLDARALAEAGADLPDQVARAPAVVAALLRSLIKALRRAGVSAQSLDREGLLDALARSCDLAPLGVNGAAGPRAAQPREDWRTWHSARLAHRSFWLQDWPSLARTGALLDWLATAPAAFTSVSLVVAPEGDDIGIRCLTRVAAPPAQLDAVCQAVSHGARQADARLFELDGEQGPAVYASAPTGGGPR